MYTRCNNWCNGQVCPRYESSQIFVQTDRIEDKISGLYTGYGGYVSGSIVVLMFSQLKLILEVIGPQPLENNVETRMLIRVN